jgi:malonyl CoA-acyl carrier protein transacylase
MARERQIALLFPGQGSQTADMRETVERQRPDLLELAFEEVGPDLFERAADGTRWAQPAIYCAALAGARDLDVEADVMAGHSLGEITALVAAEAIGAEDGLKDRGVRSKRLPVAGAFHSPLMEPAVEPFRAAVDAIEIAEPRVPVYSCVTAEPFDDVRERLVQAITHPVRWLDVLRALDARGVTEFVETGPGQVLTNLVKKSLAKEAAGA